MLQCAFLANASTPQVLIWGTSEDLRRLGALLVEISTVPRIKVIGDTHSPDRVEIKIVDEGGGMKLVSTHLQWEISSAEAKEFAKILESTADHPSPCHTYLDTRSPEGLEVKVSLNEYPSTFKP